MVPFTEVYGLAAPLRSIFGLVAINLSYKASLSDRGALFFAVATVIPRV
jgi:hypothetical protein